MVSRASLPVLRHMCGDSMAPLTELTRAELWALHLPSCNRHGKSCDVGAATAGARALQPGEDAVDELTTRARVRSHLKFISLSTVRANFASRR